MERERDIIERRVDLGDQDGEVDYSSCENKHVLESLKKKEELVKVTLMQADLEFEYPHKLEKLLVRSEILSWLDEEEKKLQNLAKLQFEQ